jgi:hypothetical protein
VGDVVKKVSQQSQERFSRFDVFLTAYMAITAHYFSITIKTVRFVPLPGMRH